MQLNQILEKIPFINTVNDLLVCEVDAIGMRASVFHRHGSQLNVTHEAHADAYELMAGVKELVQQLKKQGWVGKQALLLSPAVVQQLLELPVPAKNKLPPPQMAEKISWELEPFLIQQLRAYSIGQLLLQNKLIKPTQIEEILQAQELASASKNKEVLYKKFGELAVELRFVTQSQLDKCLSKQAWFISKSDEIHCGWVAQSTVPNQDTGLFKWLATGINKALLRQWQAAFSAQGVKLNACYPIVGNAMAVLEQADKASNETPYQELVFEVHESQLSAAHLTNGALAQLQNIALQQNPALTAISDIFYASGIDQPNRISLVDAFSRSETEINQLVGDLNHVLALPIKVYNRLGNSTNLGLKAAALHFMQQKINLPMTGVSVGEPLAPLSQRPKFRAVMACLLIVGLLGLAESSLVIRRWLIDSEKEVVDKDLAKVNAIISQIQAKVDAVKAAKESIKAKQAEMKTVTQTIDLLAKDLPQRNQTLSGILNELSRTVSEDVVIDSITEDTLLGFSVSAWAINERSAQEFAKNYQLAVHSLGYKLKNITVSSQTGRLGLLGYSVNFNVAPNETIPANNTGKGQ